MQPSRVQCAGLVIALLTAAFSWDGHAEEVSTIEVLAGRRQLFLDDWGIARLERIKRTMHQPVKRGAVIRSPQPQQTPQIRTAPVWDPRRQSYLLWVFNIDQALWQSQDGLHWQPGQNPDMRVDMAVYDSKEKHAARRFKGVLLN